MQKLIYNDLEGKMTKEGHLPSKLKITDAKLIPTWKIFRAVKQARHKNGRSRNCDNNVATHTAVHELSQKDGMVCCISHFFAIESSKTLFFVSNKRRSCTTRYAHCAHKDKLSHHVLRKNIYNVKKSEKCKKDRVKLTVDVDSSTIGVVAATIDVASRQSPSPSPSRRCPSPSSPRSCPSRLIKGREGERGISAFI